MVSSNCIYHPRIFSAAFGNFRPNNRMRAINFGRYRFTNVM